jgi:hypothetical protein
VYLNRTGGPTKIVSKGTFTLPDPVNSNPVLDGAAITFSDGVTSETIVLPGLNWVALGYPAGSGGFKYRDSSGATCKKVLVKSTVIKALCKSTLAGAPPYDSGVSPPISVVLSTGGTPQRYCAECPNGAQQDGNPATITKMRDCAAPAECPGMMGSGVCCDVAGGCGSAPSAFACLETFGGTAVGGGAVCDASGDCVTPPGTAGDCCEGTNSFDFCAMGGIDQATCEGNGGTFHTSSICDPSGVCTP